MILLVASCAGASGSGPSASPSPAEVYRSSCRVCHAKGVAGAPEMGDASAWKPRLAKGLETLTENALQGIGAMPPKGGNESLSREEVAEAVRYMVEQSR